MAKPLIAVDVDDVLADSAAGFVAFCNDRWDTGLTIDDYIEDWGLMWSLEAAEAEKRALELHHSGAFGRFAHDETALPVLRQLSKDYRLAVVTSRRDILEPETMAWLDTHFQGVFDNVHFAGMWDKPDEHSFHATKADVLAEIQADYLIDDQPKHCLGAVGIGVSAVLFGDYTWNRHVSLPEGVTRCHDWAAVQEYFDGR